MVEEYSELEETLKDFFLGSVIKPQHISIKRISEGLKLQTRAGTESGKEEYARYEASLRNILANDHEKSILRKLLHETFANRLNIELSQLEIRETSKGPFVFLSVFGSFPNVRLGGGHQNYL